MKLLSASLVLVVSGCQFHGNPTNPMQAVSRTSSELGKTQRLIVDGARDQLSWGTGYDPAYRVIGYPNGDVDRKRGVCTDVVIRALRHAGIDLQVLIHKDISAHWNLYPRYSGNPRPDSNIDQRRMPNQRVFFSRFGKKLPGNCPAAEWKPGDIVEWRLLSGRDHTGVITDRIDSEGYPLVIHNIGDGPAEEDVLRSWTITGHFRYPRSP